MPARYAQAPPQLGEHPIEAVLEAMTTAEKVRLLVGMGFSADMPGLPPIDPADANIPEKVPGAAGRTHAIPRLGIPSLTLSDGPAGVRIAPMREGDGDHDRDQRYHATAFPVATLLAASWDTALVRRVGGAFGREAHEYGVDVLLAPGMNIHRNPLGGRNFEYYSEDPLLSGRMAAAFVDGVEAEGVGTSVKHFAANNQEFNRMQSNTIVSERALREIYLKGFQIAIETSQPWTVMSAYNAINGTSASESRELLTTILREEWGFAGIVMTDWFAGRNPVAQMMAGNDLLMPGTLLQTQSLVEAVANGSLPEAQLDANVARMLRTVLKSPTFKAYPYSDAPDLAAHAQIARAAATEGMVLLKNEHEALPLPSSSAVALFGNASYDLIIGGTGSGDVNEAYSVSLDEGLTDAGFTLDATLQDDYVRHIAEARADQPATQSVFFLPPPLPEMTLGADRIGQLARTTDVAVLTLGRNAGEFADRELEADFHLTETERTLIREVSAAFHAVGKKLIVVMNVAGVTEVASWRDHADAILLAWQPGQEGGHAIADVLRGHVNPSGKLPASFPILYADVPSADNFPGKELPTEEDHGFHPIFGKPAEVIYDEGIYVGYRYYDAFRVEPAYPFGHGLSYTRFDFTDLCLSTASFDNAITTPRTATVIATVIATVTVTNTGDVAGREVVQLYIGAPGGTLNKPEQELRGFAKTDLLAPGASQTLAFPLTSRDLASYHPDRAAWMAEAGTYAVKIGASSRAIRQEAAFSLPQTVTVEQTHAVLLPQRPIDERKTTEE